MLLSAAYDAKQTSKLKAQAEAVWRRAALRLRFHSFRRRASPGAIEKSSLRARVGSTGGAPVVAGGVFARGTIRADGRPSVPPPAFEKKHGFDLAPTPDAARAAPVLSGVRAAVVPAGKGKRAGGKVGGATKAGADATKAGADATKDAKAAREMLAAVLPAAGARWRAIVRGAKSDGRRAGGRRVAHRRAGRRRRREIERLR